VKLIRLLLLLALPLLAIGCGSGSDSTSGSGAETVSPAGAPYTYEVPGGFERVPASFPGEGARYLTTVVPTDTPAHSGTLSAFPWALGPAQRAYPTAKLLRWLDRESLSFYRGAGATLAAGERTQVAGRPAICWRIHHFRNPADGIVEADGCAVVGSENVVQLGCTWKPGTRAVIERGCRELQESLAVS
jgi:hypothetical protein